MRSPQCPQEKSRGREEELSKSQRGTRGTREAEQEYIRGTTGGQKMYSRGFTSKFWLPIPNFLSKML